MESWLVNNEKTLCVHGLKDLIMLTCPYYPKTHRFSVIPIEINMTFFKNRNRKAILKFIWNHKISQMAKAMLRKNKGRGITLPDFKMYYKAIVVKTERYWNENTYRPMEQNAYTRTPRAHNEEKIISSTNSVEKTGYLHAKE